MDKSGLGRFPTMREARLTAQFEGVDPIGSSSPIFDAYVSTIDLEVFVEFRFASPVMMNLLRDRLYVMLSKVYHYRNIKKSNVYLVLLLTPRPEDEFNPRLTERLIREFQPAIANGLLKIEEITFTPEELAAFREAPAR